MRHIVYEGKVTAIDAIDYFGSGETDEHSFEVEYNDTKTSLCVQYLTTVYHDNKASLVRNLKVGDRVRVVADNRSQLVSINVRDEEHTC